MSIHGLHNYNSVCCFNLNLGIDGGEQVFSNRQTSKVQTLLHQEESYYRLILVSWLSSMCAPLPYLLRGDKMVFHPYKFICYLTIDNSVFAATLVTVYVGIPSCVIFYCYLRIFKTVCSHNSNLQLSSNGSSMINVEDIKVVRTLFVIVVFFNLCWTPVLLIDLVDAIRGGWTFPREAYVAYTFLGTISSALNPLIYGVLNKSFRKDYLKLLCCRHCRCSSCCRTRSGDGR